MAKWREVETAQDLQRANEQISTLKQQVWELTHKLTERDEMVDALQDRIRSLEYLIGEGHSETTQAM